MKTQDVPKTRAFLRPIAIAFVAVVGVAGIATASGWEWKARPMLGANEVPPVVSTAEARAQFEVEDGAIHYKVRMRSSIVGATQAHIHLQPANTVIGKANGPVVVFLYGFNAAGQDFAKGETVAEGELSPSQFIGPLAGASLDTIVSALNSGRAYVNMHTLVNRGGELRAQVVVDE